MFRDLVDREEWFLAYKNMHFSYLHFCTLLDIVQKMAFFSSLFLGNNNLESVGGGGGGGLESFRPKTNIRKFIRPSFLAKRGKKTCLWTFYVEKKTFPKKKNINLTRSKLCISSYFRVRQNEWRKTVYELSISKKPFLD